MINPFEILTAIEYDRKEKYNKLSFLGKFWYNFSPWIDVIIVILVLIGIFVGAGMAIDHYLIK